MQKQTPMTGCLPAFGRHRGYPPRWGWLRKVHLAIENDPGAMTRPDATVELGVNKSMVPAMGFWSQAFGLSRREGRDLVPTDRARWLLDDDHGADPFLELDATLWLLHWWLLSAEPCHVPSWRYLFGIAGLNRYSRRDLQRRLAWTADDNGWKPPAHSVLTADIACLVSMYGLDDHTAADFEDVLSNPFRTLQLLSSHPPGEDFADRSHLVSIHRRAGSRCPAIIQAYASIDFAARAFGTAPGSISLTRLSSDPLGPGRLLLADTAVLRHSLHRVAARHPDHLAVVQSGDGEEMLTFSSRPDHLAEDLLDTAYPGPGAEWRREVHATGREA